MHLPEFVTDALGWLAYEFARLQPFIPTYLHLVLSAVFPIFAGAHSSLSRPSSAAKRSKDKKKNEDDGASDDEDDEEPQRMEGLSASDAIMFPILAGCTLTGLYFLIKWLKDPAILNKILNWYFAVFSIFSVSRLISDGLDVLHSAIFPRYYLDHGVIYKVRPRTKVAIPSSPGLEPRTSPLPSIFSRLSLPSRLNDFLWALQVLPSRKVQLKAHIRHILDMRLAIGIHGIAGFLVGLSTVIWFNFVSKPWFLTNLMGFGFAYGTLQILSPTTFWTGSLILSGLFCYDIYFVFFTPMMVTVAKSLDIPIKLLFPRPPEQRPSEPEPTRSLSMLGLGDIVLPGIMIGLALRFDLFLFYLKKQSRARNNSQNSSPKNAAASESTPTKSKTTNKSKGSNSSLADNEGQVVKAQYQSVAGGWGDRLWTSRVLSVLPYRSSSVSLSAQNYVPRTVFPKPYFHASLTGYVLGMIATLLAMQVSEHAQPALLYLVPFVLTALWGTAWRRGEIKAMWEFSDSEEEESEKNKEEDEKKKKKAKNTNEKTKDSEKGSDNSESTSTDTPSRSTRSSFFSRERGEARAKLLSDTLSGGSNTQEDEDSAANEEQKDKSIGKDQTKEHQRSWFSVSFKVLPLSKISHNDKLDQDGKKLTHELDESPKYNLRSKSKTDERSGKRRRIS